MIRLPKNLIFVAGSTCSGKTTALDNSDVLRLIYDKSNSELRPFYFLSTLYRAIALAQEQPYKVFALDRAPLDYFVWSYKIRGLTDIYPLTSWQFIEATLKNTILVYHENEECALAERNISAEQYRKSQEFYKHYAEEKEHKFLHVVKGRFITPKDIEIALKKCNPPLDERKILY